MNAIGASEMDALPSELLRLTRGERRYAVPLYLRLMVKINAVRPELDEHDKERRALSSAYFTAGRFWLMFVAPPGIAAVLLSDLSSGVPSLTLIAVAALFFGAALVRSVRAIRFCPHLNSLKH
jgi:hypothetical protein